MTCKVVLTLMALTTGIPFDLPVTPNPDSLISMASPAPIAPDGPRITVDGDSFRIGEKRFRVFGVNLGGRICPSREESVDIAARLAGAGVNSVRLHGIERAEWWVTPEEKLSAEQKDRRDQFDFLIAQLAQHGIYSNFNLQTYRRYSQELGLPGWDNLHDVILDLFAPKLIEAQKGFARRLLEHVNPYRKLRYADDPAVAFVEINNENSLFLWNAAELLPKLPEYYRNILQGKYNEFLKKRYSTTEALKKAWGALEEGETLEDGKVKLFGTAEKPGDRRMVDRMLCLMEVEQAYWDGMYNFVKKDLGCQALITGTIVFGPCNLYAQRNMDWIDCHAYWGHPRWAEGISRWDRVKWTLPRAAMVDSPEKTVTDLDELSGILFFMAAQQMRNKPFTVSEYNHCAPNDYQAECVPILSSFAAAQDWDGLWLFTYEENRRQVHWFNFAHNPAKWGFMQAGAAIFRDGGLTTLPQTRHLSYAAKDKPLESMIRHQIKRNYDMFAMLRDQYGVKWSDFIDTRLVVNLDGDNQQGDGTAKADTNILWDKSADGKGRYIASGPGGRVWIGHADRLKGQQGLTVTKPDFAVVTLTPLDGQSLAECKKALVTAIFRAENTGMKFNEKRDSVGESWGSLPVLIEPVEGTIAGIAELKGQWTCTALKPDGTAGEAVPVTYDDNQLPRFELSAKFKTIWYLLERK
ncbi:MAG: beta-galactosidase [Phycisphaerae bacterium]|nr:beta-galactosidase [Phycisphaerae bacterium]